MNRPLQRSTSPDRQRGAALFIALMLLIIVSILGVSVAQVTALQERMANNYRVDDVAFQNADGFLRGQEVEISQSLSSTRSADCRPTGTGDMTKTWDDFAENNDSSFESMQGDQGAGLTSGMQGNPPSSIGDVAAGSWQCLLFRVAAVGVGFDNDDEAARTIVQSTYILE